MKDKKTFDIPVHSIIVMVGPSNAGKTHFVRNHLVPALQDNMRPDRATNIQHVSSDDIRRSLGQLHEEDFHKYDNEMMYTSKQAFDVLYNRVDAVTSYPINAEYVIVDTKGISDGFREEIKKIASKNNYNYGVVVMNYKDKGDYLKNIPEDADEGTQSFYKTQIHKDIKNLRRDTLGNLKTKDHDFIHKITSNDFDQYEITSSNFQEYVSRILDPNIEYTIIGDVHGCFDELREIIEKNGFEITRSGLIKEVKGRQILLAGDIVDKGPKIKETIQFVYNNLRKGRVKMVVGNHENFVYKFLKGEIKQGGDITEEFLTTYFNTISIIQDDEKYRGMLDGIMDMSKEFYIHRDFIVTHAPCKNKYLGKMDSRSLRNQRMISYPKSRDYDGDIEYVQAVEEYFSFLQDGAEFNQPYHIFGHVNCQEMRVMNKINIDHGCVAGGRLTSIVINPNRKPFIQSVDSKQPVNEGKKLLPFFSRKSEHNRQVDLDGLDQKEQTRIKYFCKEQVPYISGTMCPADKDEEVNDIESLDKAIEYYRNKGVDKVILQPKYMGSRCNIMLYDDLEKCYATTRNGYRIKHVEDMPIAYAQLIEKFKSEFEKDVECILLDVELMPWSVMGKGLIERDFKVVGDAISGEADFLRENGFDGEYRDLLEKYEGTDFGYDVVKTPKKEMIEKYGQANYRTFDTLRRFMKEYVTVEELEEMAKVYNHQMDLYGQEGDIHTKPFMILKKVFKDGSEEVFVTDNHSNMDIFMQVSDDSFASIYIDDTNVGEIIDGKGLVIFNGTAKEVAHEFNRRVTEDQQMEGLVVKPDRVFTPLVAPFLKVRNPRYLSIIYGPDYKGDTKYQKLIKRKRVSGKLKTSIKEYEIGKKILEIPIKDINEDNQEYKQLVAQMIAEEKREVRLDPRL